MMLEHSKHVCAEILRRAGGELWGASSEPDPPGHSLHETGTVRFGNDPSESALDVNCKAHDLDNLYVVDTAFFPSSSAVNPALTAMANALRVGDHLLERLGASSVASGERNGLVRADTQTGQPHETEMERVEP